nr:hypothetical protein [Flavobacteriales bacterium]
MRIVLLLGGGRGGLLWTTVIANKMKQFMFTHPQPLLHMRSAHAYLEGTNPPLHTSN